MTDKIKPQHHARKAILYVRQSSPGQVAHSPESQRLQYAVADRLRALGWSEVEIIDEDLGRSAAGGVERAGFQRMVAEVCLGRVGAVAAREVSRFARNSRDWQQLVEVCRVVDTLLIDHEVVYDPRHSNDRLLLGLKGTLNEYELDLLRQRAWDARRAKACRGELITSVPVGFLKTEDQRLELDPDRRVQEAIRLVFRKFVELGAVRQVLLWFLQEGLELPACPAGGAVVWKRPRYHTVWSILTNPTYAGAYVYGRTEVVSHYEDGAPVKRSRRKPLEEALAFFPNRHEGYVSWEEFERVQRMIHDNDQAARPSKPGAAKRGVALLAGLLRCRRCGRKLVVTYTGRAGDVLRYACSRGNLDCGEPKCIQFGGREADERVGRELLRVVQPAAVEAARLAQAEQGHRQDEVRAALNRDLEAATYTAERARRQYDAADPENRLVAAELERRWNVALQRVGEVEQRLARLAAPAAAPATESLRDLASDLAVVWDHPGADVRLKKRLLRTLIHEVVVDVADETAEVVLVIHWQGGVHSEVRVSRRRHGRTRRSTAVEIVEAVRVLNRVCADEGLAAYLNRAGLRTGYGNRWTRERVVSLRQHHGIAPYSEERQAAEGWLNLTDAAARLGVSARTLRVALERGPLQGVQPLPDGPWVIHRSELETETAQAVVARARRRRGDPAGRAAAEEESLFSSDLPEEVV